MGFWFCGVDEVGELHGVLDKEDGDVVADNVPVTLFRVELYGEATDIADCVGGATTSKNSGKPDKDWRRTSSIGEDASVGYV